MRFPSRTLALTLTAAALLAAPLLVERGVAQEETRTVQQLTMGEHWGGPNVAPADLVGKVVLFEIYGS